MGKVKGEDKFPDESVNRRRKKRKKELDLLRRNVLEAKRKLREKTAPSKTQKSSFNKVLNSFADRRQANDNKTQGFDSRGRKAGLKKMCNRLLPGVFRDTLNVPLVNVKLFFGTPQSVRSSQSRKPQVGIFANGSKGAEIKRVNLSFNESDRARFEGDLQKVLGDGKRKCKESRPDEFDKIDTERQGFIGVPDEKLERKPVQNFENERQSGKRKMQVPLDMDERTGKKLYSHTEMENTRVPVECTNVKSERDICMDRKWKRSLFRDEENDYQPISDSGIDQLRFSPKIGKAKTRNNISASKLFLDKKRNFNYEQLGRMAIKRYEKLCNMVSTENFDNCLREIPHYDPLTQVKETLINFYGKTCGQKALRNEASGAAVPLAEESSSTSSKMINFDIHETKYFGGNSYLASSKSFKVNGLPVRGVRPGLGISENFSHRKTGKTFSPESKPLTTKVPGVMKSKNISVPTREVTVNKLRTNSLCVNRDDSRKNTKSDMFELFKIERESVKSVLNLEDSSSVSRFAGIPSNRKKIMLRYLNEVNNQEPSISPSKFSALSAEDNNVQECYLGDRFRRYEIGTKKGGTTLERKVDEMCCPPPYQASIAKQTLNSVDVNCDSVKTCLGLDQGEFWKVTKEAEPTSVVNLGSASSSTLARIPSNRGEILLRYLQDVNNQETIREEKGKVFLIVDENNKTKKRYLGDPLRRHQIKNTSVQRPSKNERHVPAILRKSQASKKNKSDTAGTVLARGTFDAGNLRWKSSKFNSEKLSSESQVTSVKNLYDKRETLKESPPAISPFPVNCDLSINPEQLNLMRKMPGQDIQLRNLEGPIETPSIINALYNRNAETLEAKRNFIDVGFSCDVEIGQQNMANRSRDVNFSKEFKQSGMNYRSKNSAVDVELSNFHNDQQSRDFPIFRHQQRSDAGAYGITVCDEKKEIPTLGDQDSQRFPVFLKRKTFSSTANRKRYQMQRQGGLFTANEEPKMIVIQNQNLQGVGDDARGNFDIPDIRYKIDSQNLQANGAGLKFAQFSPGIEITSMRPDQFQNCRHKMERFQIPQVSYENVNCQGTGQLQIPQRGPNTHDLQNLQHIQLPRITYQNDKPNVVNNKHTISDFGNNQTSFLEPRTFDVPVSQRVFQQASSSNIRMPETCGTFYRSGNRNLEIQRNCTAVEPAHFFDGGVNFVVPKNESKYCYQNGINIPINDGQISHGQNYNQILLSEDRNCNYEYIIDPECPQAGYKWNQIEELSGAQIPQHVIQPVYNVTDGYRPQLPHNYFSADS